MVEILRTNDLVLITVIELILKAERIAYFIADQNMAAAEGSLGFLPRRILVDWRREGGRAASLPKRVWEKNCSMAEPSAAPESAGTLTEDQWLGGRLLLMQPKRGHRVGTDAALLVAAAGDAWQGRIVDVGAGVGAVGLALAQRNALTSVDLVELDPELAQLADSNAARNGLQARTRVLRLDALNPRDRREAGLAELANCVVTNPPFFDARTVRASPDGGKARAHVLAGRGRARRLPTGFKLRLRCSRRAGGS